MTVCCDIDDTLLYSRIENGKYTVAGKNDTLIRQINMLYDNGHTVVLHTGRHWNHLELTREQLANAGVKYSTLVMGKPVADVYIDDKAMRPNEFFG